MGILLYFMVTGLMPFRAENVGKLKKSILDGHYSIPTHVSEECQQVIRKKFFFLLINLSQIFLSVFFLLLLNMIIHIKKTYFLGNLLPLISCLKINFIDKIFYISLKV